MTLTTGPRLLAPGWIPREPGLETYWVRPGGVTCLRVDQGDEVSVVDVEGRQRAEVTTVAVHPGDQEGAAALGLRQDLPATTVAALARRYREGRRGDGIGQVVDALAERGIDPDDARAAHLFGAWSPAGSRETFTAQSDSLVVVAAPETMIARSASTHSMRVPEAIATRCSGLMPSATRPAPSA